ncbi:MAG: penicillin acylase family protein [Sphingomonadales bacterium]
MLRRFGVGVMALVAIVLIAGLVWEPLTAVGVAPPPARTYDARILRDEWGVPHVFGKTDADAAYALAYAHAEDDFSTLEEVVAMTRGRAGALTGADGAKVDYVRALLDIPGTVARRYAAVPADVRALLDGYAAGLNLYAARHPEEVRLSKLFPVNGQDIAAGFALRSPFFFGLDDTIGALTDNKDAPRGTAQSMSAQDTARAMTPLGKDPAMNGSNAFAVSPKRMSDGRTWLISNSHQPYEGGVAWYEASMHSGQGLDMSGALFPGSPFVLLGHNRNLGWTNTVNGPDLIDVYKLVMNADGTQYRYDGKWLPLERHRVWLPVKFGPFTLPVPKMVYRALQGPVIVNKNGAFAIRYAAIDSLTNLEQYFRIQKAQNWDEWTRAMSLGGIPATNFVYADKTGRIAFLYNAMFPPRKPGFDYRGVLPGDTSADMWEGSLGFAAMPKVVDPASGWVVNANNAPFQAAGPGSELDPKAFSSSLGIERRTTNRITRAIELLSAEKGAITPERLLQIKFDTTYSKASFAGRWMQKLLAVDVSREPDLAAAQSLLRQWDWNSDGNGRADALGESLMHVANRAAYRGEALPDAREKLREVVDKLTKGFGRIDPPLGEVQRLRRGGVDMPANGGTDTLRAATTWDPQPDGRMRVKHGDSFIMLMAWDKAGRVEARSIQPYGAATTRPRSPHYTDQMALFEARKFKPAYFDRADIIAHTKRAYRP